MHAQDSVLLMTNQCTLFLTSLKPASRGGKSVCLFVLRYSFNFLFLFCVRNDIKLFFLDEVLATRFARGRTFILFVVSSPFIKKLSKNLLTFPYERSI